MKKVKPIQPKLRLRDRRRRMMWVKVAAGSAVVLVALAAAFYVARLPSLTIAAVEVNGASVVDKNSVEALAREELSGSYAYFIPRANAFLAPRGEIEKKILSSFPAVGTITLTHRELETLVVTLGERVPEALWCTNDGVSCYFMDADGFIYREAPFSDAYIRYSGSLSGEPMKQMFLSGGFPELNAFIKETSKTINKTPESVTIDANNDTSLAFAGGGVLRFVRTDDSQATLANVASVFGSQSFKSGREFEYADFRYGNKVYVKFVGE